MLRNFIALFYNSHLELVWGQYLCDKFPPCLIMVHWGPEYRPGPLSQGEVDGMTLVMDGLVIFLFLKKENMF